MYYVKGHHPVYSTVIIKENEKQSTRAHINRHNDLLGMKHLNNFDWSTIYILANSITRHRFDKQEVTRGAILSLPLS